MTITQEVLNALRSRKPVSFLSADWILLTLAERDWLVDVVEAAEQCQRMKRPHHPDEAPVVIDLSELDAAIQRNPEALKAYLGTGEGLDRLAFGAAWFRAIVDLLRAHVRHGGNLLDGLIHLLLQEQVAKARAMRDEYDALAVNICARCRQPLRPTVPR